MVKTPFHVSEIFVLFGLAALVNLLGNIIPLPLLQYTTKPLLMPLLAAAIIASGNIAYNNKKLLLTGILLSWVGDVLLILEYKSSLYFIAGLSAFLCAHVMYILYFLKVKRQQQSLLKKVPLLAVAVVVYAAGLVALLYPGLGSLRIPVLVYAAIIASMLICCLHAFAQLPPQVAKWMLTGAALFVLSDSLLAINKFYQPFPLAGAAIMLTYCLAQFCIVKGGILRR